MGTDLILKGSLMNETKKKMLEIFHVHNKVDGEKMTLEIFGFPSMLIHRCHHQENLCINNYQKFLHSKLIEHVRDSVKKAVINLSIEMR